jgi:cytochrome c553
MRAHFSESEEIRQAIIDGNISATSKPAQALGNMKALGKAKPGWKPAMDALQKAALRFGQSPDLPSAAAAVADIGVACGRCHRSTNAMKLEVGTPPAAGKTIEDRMKRHAWASDRLWEGLYAPSDAAWDAGAKALSDEPFPKDVLSKGGVHARSAAATFKTLVTDAPSKRTPEDRAKLYAALLETCSSCHMATGKK